MYWFWIFLFATQPALLVLGLFGLFGKEAEKAAEEVAKGMGVVILVLLAVALIGCIIYIILKVFGVI